MSENYRDPKASEARIRAFARRVLRRVHALGAKTATLDDIEQELWVAWCKAVEAYDPKGGASFQTFLYRGMQNHINRYVEQQYERFHEQTVALALDAAPSDDVEGGSLIDIIPDESVNFDSELENEDAFQFAIQKLSERARIFVQLLKDQPTELVKEFQKLHIRGEYARKIGVPVITPQRMTAYIIFDFMGASRHERTQILAEVEELGKYMIARLNS